MRRFMIPFLLVLMLVVTSCGRNSDVSNVEKDDRPVLDVNYCAGMDRYPAVKVLEDKESLLRLESEMGCTINLHVFDSETDSIDLASSGFSGILLVDDPNYTVRLSNAKIVDRIDSLSIPRNFGTNNGEQYGYVFSGSSGRIPVLLVDVDAFESAGIKGIDYSIDDFCDALSVLQDLYQVPLALCGDPTQAGYFVIQQMYGISPMGGREISASDDGNVVYDKLSEKGSAYLVGLRRLFSESLIPSDMLILNEYGVMKMLLNRTSAAAVFTDMTYAKEAVMRMEAQGRRVAIARIPVDDSRIEFDIYRQLMGFVSRGYSDTDTVMKFFRILDEMADELCVDDALEGVGEYELFSTDSADMTVASDSFGDSLYAMILYYKSELDLRIIVPYYGMIASCDYEMSRFDELCQTWLSSEISTNYEYIHGKALLRMFSQMMGKGGVK